LGMFRASRNSHGQQSAYSLYLRVLGQQGRQEAALAITLPPLRAALPAPRAEVLSTRALTLAAVGRADEAFELLSTVRGSTQAVEPLVLVSAVDAVVALKRRAPQAVERVLDLEQTAFATGAVDLLVSTYRSVPELLAILLRASPQRDRLIELVTRAHDEDLANAVGQPLRQDDDPRTRLSPREREVYDLLRQGLTNLQIASVLFIEESTVKVHVHHIYDKLGERSRTALAVQAALGRSNQATSAIEGADTEGS
jgi:DNA-binding NarL/FixJ family response regulator